MKKILSLLLSAALACSLAACGGGTGTAGEGESTTPPVSTEPEVSEPVETPDGVPEETPDSSETPAASADARPELAAQVENWDSYDTIFVGCPNWWSDAPMAVYTFLESYDWTGKTLVPFNTSASGGFGRSLSGIEESAAGAEILEGLSFTSSTLDDAQSEVTAWLDGLGLS